MIFNGIYKFRVQGHSIDSLCLLTIPTLKNSPAISSLVEDGVKVIVTELPDNPGTSICNAHKVIRAKICKDFNIQLNHLIYIEHWPTWSAEEGGYDRDNEEYHLVRLSNEQPYWENLNPGDILSIKNYLHVVSGVDNCEEDNPS